MGASRPMVCPWGCRWSHPGFSDSAIFFTLQECHKTRTPVLKLQSRIPMIIYGLPNEVSIVSKPNLKTYPYRPPFMITQRPQSSSFWGLPYRILLMNPQKGTTLEPLGSTYEYYYYSCYFFTMYLLFISIYHYYCCYLFFILIGSR